MKKVIIIIIGSMLSFCSYAKCWKNAAEKYKVDPYILYSIAFFESTHDNTKVNHNQNGTVDKGIMQINSIWLPELSNIGYTEKTLNDPCLSLKAGAYILSQKIAHANGNIWKGVGMYHSSTPKRRNDYSDKVRRVYTFLKTKGDIFSGFELNKITVELNNKVAKKIPKEKPIPIPAAQKYFNQHATILEDYYVDKVKIIDIYSNEMNSLEKSKPTTFMQKVKTNPAKMLKTSISQTEYLGY